MTRIPYDDSERVYRVPRMDGKSRPRRLTRCECRDLETHVFYTSGKAFRWRWPKLTILHPAKGGTFAALNRYPHNVIGAYVVVAGRGIGIRWKGNRDV